MPNPRISNAPFEAPWWLVESDACPFCVQENALNLENRCYECDRPVCPFCVTIVQETKLVRCPVCGQQESCTEEAKA
jgi:hypothetical protein